MEMSCTRKWRPSFLPHGYRGDSLFAGIGLFQPTKEVLYVDREPQRAAESAGRAAGKIRFRAQWTNVLALVSSALRKCDRMSSACYAAHGNDRAMYIETERGDEVVFTAALSVTQIGLINNALY